VKLRIVISDPVPGVQLAMQKGKDELVWPLRHDDRECVFEIEVAWKNGKPGGPFVHGPAGAKFLYVNAGKRAAQLDTLVDRRAKLHVAEIVADGDYEVHIAGRGRDGGPVCATVPVAWKPIK
jgi:hypothetical protein